MDQELEVFQKRKKKINLLRTILLSVFVVILLGAIWFALDRWYFLVRRIEVSDSVLYAKEDIIAACGVETGTRLFAVNKKTVERNIEENFPFLTSVTVRRLAPHTLSVTFREELGEIALTLGRETFAVDSELTVLARIPAGDATHRLGLTSEGVSRCIVGEKIAFFDESVPDILSHLVQSLDQAEMLPNVVSLDLRDKFNLRMDYAGRFDIMLGEDGDLGLKFAMVKKVLEELYTEDTGEIDISDPNNAYVRLYNRA